MGLRSCFFWALPATLLLAAGCSIYDTSLLVDAPPGGAGAGGQGGSTAGSAGVAGAAGEAGAGGAGEGGEGGQGGAGEAGVGGAPGGMGGEAGAGGAVPECVGDATCDDKNDCTADRCVEGKCTHTSDNTLTPPQTAGDCRVSKCVNGKATVSNDDTDTPADDSNPCTNEVCEAGVPNYDPVAENQACEISGKAGFCKSGKCQVDCSGNSECDDKNPCTDDSCSGGKCLFNPLADGTATPGATDTAGDCKTSTCLKGAAVDSPDLNDKPTASDECKTPKCTEAGPGADPVADNTPCTAGVDFVCAAGACVKPTCGDGVRMGKETCDGNDLGGKTCADIPGFGPGATGLLCNDDCALDSSQCKGVCGNGVVEPGEECDDATSPGAAGDGCSVHCAKEPAAGELVITEVMINPEQVPSDEGEWFEVLNTSSSSYDLRGLKITSNAGESHVIEAPAPVTLAPGQYAVLAKNSDTTKNGGLTPLYTYGTKITFSNSSDDFIQIEVAAPTPVTVDKVTWTGSIGGSTKYKGASFSLSTSALNATANDDVLSWCAGKVPFATSTDKGTPGAANDGCP